MIRTMLGQHFPVALAVVSQEKQSKHLSWIVNVSYYVQQYSVLRIHHSYNDSVMGVT